MGEAGAQRGARVGAAVVAHVEEFHVASDRRLDALHVAVGRVGEASDILALQWVHEARGLAERKLRVAAAVAVVLVVVPLPVPEFGRLAAVVLVRGVLRPGAAADQPEVHLDVILRSAGHLVGLARRPGLVVHD